jgi:hypothetical protein
MKRYIRCNTSSLIDELNELPIYKGYSGIPSYKEINQYEDILLKFPIGTIIGMDWDSGDCFYRKKSDNEWEGLESPQYNRKYLTNSSVAKWLAGRGNWCKKPLWIDTDETFNAIWNNERSSNIGNSNQNFWGKSEKRNFGQFPQKKDFYGF